MLVLDFETLLGKRKVWNGDLSLSYPCKTSAFRDVEQPNRLLFDILVLDVLRQLAHIDAVDLSKSFTPISPSVAATIASIADLAGKISSSSSFEASTIGLVRQAVQASHSLLQFVVALQSNAADMPTLAEALKKQVTQFADLLDATWASLFVEGTSLPIVPLLDGPDHFGKLQEVSFFISRLAAPIFSILHVWSKVYPARLPNKATDAQKGQHGEARTLLRRVLQSVKDIYLRCDQLGTKDLAAATAQFELSEPAQLASFGSLSAASGGAAEVQRSLETVRDTILASAKDSLVNLSLSVRDKLKDLASVKF